MPWDPLKGPRLAPAWKALLSLVADNEWHPWAEALDVMLATSDLERKTCDGMIHKGVKEGRLVRLGDYDQRLKRDNRLVGRGRK